MPFLYLAAAIAIAILLYLFFAKIRIVFEYKKYPGEKLYTSIKLSYGFINLSGLLKKKKLKLSQNKQETDIGIIDKIKKYEKTLKILCKVYSKNRWFIRNRINVERLNFHLKFGLGDAAATGIATGAINSVLYWLLAFVNRVGTVKKHYFEVVPVFEGSGFISEARGSISLRMINILTIAVRVYLTYKRVSK